MTELQRNPWKRDRQMRYLSALPLPDDFSWPHRDGGEQKVWPSHSALKAGYGKWLRETPYFPGLFELSCEIVARELARREPLAGGEPVTVPTGGELAEMLQKLRAEHAEEWIAIGRESESAGRYLAHFLQRKLPAMPDGNLSLF